jgi:transposase
MQPSISTAKEERRAALIQLVPALCNLVLLRKLLAGRVLSAVREAQQQMQIGATLPVHFQHVDLIPHLHCDVGSSPGRTIEERAAVLRFSLWDKRSWVLGHQDRYNQENVHLARKGARAYREDRNTLFVQFHGPPEDLLWFGDLVAHNLMRMIEPHRAFDEGSRKRIQLGRDLGFPRGCHCSRCGLLDTGDRWFAENACAGEQVFEPEALYRGVLFGSALVVLVLSGGLGASELLQVSVDRWMAPEATGSPVERWGEAGAPGQIHLQSLCPPNTSSEVAQLLEEIKRELERVHGEVPVVRPFSPRPKRLGVLQPERYLFQWQGNILLPADLTVLVRFVLNGLKLPNGERMHISVELLKESAPLPSIQVDHDLKRLRDDLLAPLAAGLSASSLVSYQQDLLSYLRFAGSAERAYQPETFSQWIAHLSQSQTGKPFNAATVSQRVTPVRRSMVEAGRRGNLDPARAVAFNNIRIQPARRRGPAPKVNAAVSKWLITQRQARPGITGEELRKAYVREFSKEISTATLYSALARLRLAKPAPAAVTEDDQLWVVEQCERNLAITARELGERIGTERGKKVSKKELNRIRASHGLRRPRNSPPSVQPRRPASYKLEDADIAWLVQQRRENPELSGTQLQKALEEQRGKEIGDRAINAILHKRGLGVGRPERSRGFKGASSDS